METSKLFQVTLKSMHNRSLVDRVEYIKCKNEKILRQSITQACESKFSEYYGYTTVVIEEAKHFPEMVQMKVTL